MNTSGTARGNNTIGSNHVLEERRRAMPHVPPSGVVYLHDMQPKTRQEVRAIQKAQDHRAASRKRAKQARKRQRR